MDSQHALESQNVLRTPVPDLSGLSVAAVVVTHDRPELLRQCLNAMSRQDVLPGRVLVIDNASASDTAEVIAEFPDFEHLRLSRNLGGAAGFRAGIEAALARDVEYLWLMDDDGHPSGAACLSQLMDAAARHDADILGPLITDPLAPERVSFPIRINGRSLFLTDEVVSHGPVQGFTHLFNGALIRARLFDAVGLPDPRFFIRGDEVEFFYRARKAGARIVLDPAIRFLHPSSRSEIHPIMGGLFYAVVPSGPIKQFYQFRNRGHIFRQYGMWNYLAADVVRYGWYFLISRQGDVGGFRRWAGATWTGFCGKLEAEAC